MQLIASSRNFGLDALRALAITLVIVSHTTYLIFPENESVIITFVRVMGATGVDLFFVLSGFLIGGVLLKTIQSKKRSLSNLILFWIRRWLRTLPSYFVVLLLNVILLYIFDSSLPDKIIHYFLFLQNFMDPHPAFFTEAWSLSIEEYAYLILPLILFITVYLLPKYNVKKLFLITTLLVIIALFFLKINYYQNSVVENYKQWSVGFRKVVIYRLDAIYIGFLLLYCYREFTNFFKRFHKFFALLGVFMFFGVHGYIYAVSATPETHFSFYVFVYLLIIEISLACLFPSALLLSSRGSMQRLVEYVSTRSYAIYLINYSIVLLTIQRFELLSEVSVLVRVVYSIGFLILSLLLSEFLYHFIEQPVMEFRNRKYPFK